MCERFQKYRRRVHYLEAFSGRVNSARDLARKCLFFMSAPAIFLKALAHLENGLFTHAQTFIFSLFRVNYVRSSSADE